MARSDYQTPIQNQIIFSDFPDSFTQSPFSSDLSIVTNENSVKQSIKNIVLTILGQRPYNQSIGSSGAYNLFGLMDGQSAQLIRQAVLDALTANEPRAGIISIVVTLNPTGNSYDMVITFTILNNPAQFSVSVAISRVR